jgi:Notch-like protein
MKASISANGHEALKFLSDVFKFPFPNIHMTPVTNKETNKDIVKSLKLKYSYGYIEIPQHILKISLPFILSPLTYMCNKSLSLGVFPRRLKYSQINPIFKKSARTDVANYRPISLLTSFSKIFEKVIYSRLQYHLDINNISAHEHGFQTKFSTDSATHDLINTILSA